MAPIYTDEMFNTQGESTTLADMNVGSSAAVGNYSPSYPGRLAKVVLLWAGEAVTSLAEAARVELECTIWKPNRLRYGIVMAGLRTAPAFPIPFAEWPTDQEVQTDQPIKGQYIHNTAATPITSNLRVYGVFVTA